MSSDLTAFDKWYNKLLVMAYAADCRHLIGDQRKYRDTWETRTPAQQLALANGGNDELI